MPTPELEPRVTPAHHRRRNRRKCVHFRFPAADTAHADDIEHVWCAKYGPHYECLGAHGCPNYTELPVMQDGTGAQET